jgi:hypothetical protein
MKYIISFLLGALSLFYFMSLGTKNVHEVWQQAYQVGRDDGEVIARSQYELTDEQLRYECERLHWEVLDGKQR